MNLLTLGKALYGLFDGRQRRTFHWVVLLSAMNALLEAIAAALVFEMIDSLVNESEGTQGRVAVIVNSVFGKGSGQRVTIILCAVTITFYALKTCSSVFEQVVQQRFIHRSGAKFSTRVVAAYLRVPIHFHNLQTSGELMRNAWNSVEVLVRSTMLGVMSLLSETFTALALVAILLAFSPAVTPLLITGLGGLVLVLYRVLRPRLSQWGQQTQELSADAFQTMNEVFGGMRDIRIFHRESFFVGKYQSIRQRFAEAFWKSSVASMIPRYLLETTFVWAVSVAILIFAARKEANAQTISLIGLYAYAGFRLLPSGTRVIAALTNIRFGESAVAILTQALNVPQESGLDVIDSLPSLHSDIELRDVSYIYPETDHAALQHIDLRIRRGERVGIVGSTGAGKSTLADILLGLMEPTSGALLIDGVETNGKLAAWRQQVSCVSQTVYLLDDSVRANVAFGLPASEQSDVRVMRALEMAQLKEFIDTLPDGANTRLGERGVRLSGGQRQRVAVARALYLDPTVLILDEATAALDAVTEEEVMAAIRTLPGHLTTIMIAHRLSTVRDCDWLILLEGGKIIAKGTYSELLQESAKFQKLAVQFPNQ